MKMLAALVLLLVSVGSLSQETFTFLPENQIRNNDLNMGWMCPYRNSNAEDKHLILSPEGIYKVSDVSDVKTAINPENCVPAFRFEKTHYVNYVYSYHVGVERGTSENTDIVTGLPVYKTVALNKSTGLISCLTQTGKEYLLYSGGRLSEEGIMVCRVYSLTDS